MRATFKLLNSYFFKTAYGPVFAFVFPTLLVGILGNIMRIEYIFPGIMAMVGMFIGVLALPLALMELKQSSLFKYIGSSPVNNKKFSSVVILYYVFIMFVSIWVLMGTTALIFMKDVFPGKTIDSVHQGIFSGIYTWFGSMSFFLANVIHMVLALAIGLLIATLAKTPQQALTTGLIIVIPSMFLSGMVLSVDIIGQSSIMQWLSRFMIFRYTTGNLIVASTPLDQIGDLVQHLSISEKTVLFNNVVLGHAPNHFLDDGTVNPQWQKWQNLPARFQILDGMPYQGTSGQAIIAHKGEIYGIDNTGLYIIHNYDELMQASQMMTKDGFFGGSGGLAISPIVADLDLYKLVFAKTSEASDNNIFNFINGWGVRRVPDVDSLREFITTYFKGSDGKGGDTSRFINIYQKYILHDDYGWLNAFFKQTNLLYTKVDRVLNVFLPLITSAGFTWYAVKKFSWSSR